MALVTGACYGQPVYVGPAPTKPLPYGLFSVSEMHDAGPGHWQQGVEWEPVVCGPAALYPCPTCVQNATVTSPAKAYVGPAASDFAAPFTVYGSFHCSPIGNWDRAEERARELLSYGEERAVEQAIADGTVHNSKALQDATTVDITPVPGTPVTLAQGLAILEAYIGAHGAGQGVILGNRREILLSNADGGLIYVEENVPLATLLGTPVAAVSGYAGRVGPNNVAAGAGNAWLFALGSAPRIWRSDVFLTSGREASLKTATNDLQVLAERTYVVGWDCFTAGILVASV